MRRRISLLLAAVMTGTTLLLFGPAKPASSVMVCAFGLGNVTVTPGLLYPVLVGLGAATGKDHLIDILIGDQVNTLHSFFLGISVGGCVHPPGTGLWLAGANGVLLGFCGHSTGTGTLNGETVAYVSAGTVLVATGGVVGMGTVTPAPFTGTGSCEHVATGAPLPPTTTFALPGGARHFILDAVGVGLNCGATTTPASTLFATPTLLLTQPVGIHTGTLAHATVRVCTAPDPLL